MGQRLVDSVGVHKCVCVWVWGVVVMTMQVPWGSVSCCTTCVYMCYMQSQKVKVLYFGGRYTL